MSGKPGTSRGNRPWSYYHLGSLERRSGMREPTGRIPEEDVGVEDWGAGSVEESLSPGALSDTSGSWMDDLICGVEDSPANRRAISPLPRWPDKGKGKASKFAFSTYSDPGAYAPADPPNVLISLSRQLSSIHRLLAQQGQMLEEQGRDIAALRELLSYQAQPENLATSPRNQQLEEQLEPPPTPRLNPAVPAFIPAHAGIVPTLYASASGPQTREPTPYVPPSQSPLLPPATILPYDPVRDTAQSPAQTQPLSSGIIAALLAGTPGTARWPEPSPAGQPWRAGLRYAPPQGPRAERESAQARWPPSQGWWS